MLTSAQFLLGLVLLVLGAELLVRGASRLATTLGISPLVVGITVVAFGTSAPELAVSLRAALAGQPDLTIGNVVGSNICNVLLILGIAALVVPLIVAQQLVRLEVPLLIGVSLLLLLLAQDGSVSRVEGLLLVGGAIIYIAWSVRQSRRESVAVKEQYQPEPSERPHPRAWPFQLVQTIAGLALLVVGAQWLVDGAIAFARLLGVSELVIGLTVVAAGTSLPEMATSVLASLRGERDIAVGNVIGSGLFNILLVLGLTATIAPAGVPVPAAVVNFDLPVMIGVAIACLPIFFTGYCIARWEGGLFLAYYAAYTLYVILAAAQHDALPRYSTVMLEFVLPLTVVTLFVIAGRSLRRQRSENV